LNFFESNQKSSNSTANLNQFNSAQNCSQNLNGNLNLFLGSPIYFETPNVRNFYEINANSILDKTPSSKKIQVFKSPMCTSNSKKNSI
jgi:hypothetical protein